MTDTLTFFLFGTLRDKDLLDLVAGTDAYGVAVAYLPNFETVRADGHAFPLLKPKQDARAAGLLLTGLTQNAFDRIAFFEGVYDYWINQQTVRANGVDVQAQVFFPPENLFDGTEPWDLSIWQHGAKAVALSEASEIMSFFDNQTPFNTPVFKHGTMMRAKSRVRATERFAPVHIRSGFSRDDVSLLDVQRPYARYFGMEDWTLQHAQFDGSVSGVIERSTFATADAVTVLPYDPVLDRVVLIEQFRVGAWSRGDPHPWVLEVVAGRCDGQETPKEVAIKEVAEETGVTVQHLEHICDYYPTPGGCAEYYYNYLAIVDLADVEGGIHGLDTEGEDIKSHILSFDALMETLKTGEADCGPLWVSALWLAQERKRLRDTWGNA